MSNNNKNIIIIIRGHIRNSFENTKLLDMIKKISDKYNISIYIHTWNIQQSNVSWRQVEEINNLITDKLIYDYFKEIKVLIKHIIIENDTKIKLIGNLEGTIGTTCPIIGWKRYLYGQYQIMNYLRNYCSDEYIINMRFDVFSNSNSINEKQIIDLIDKNYDKVFLKNIFLYNNLQFGLDNVFCGNIHTLYKLCKYFNENLDYIVLKNKKIAHQEFLLFIENELIF